MKLFKFFQHLGLLLSVIFYSENGFSQSSSSSSDTSININLNNEEMRLFSRIMDSLSSQRNSISYNETFISNTQKEFIITSYLQKIDTFIKTPFHNVTKSLRLKKELNVELSQILQLKNYIKGNYHYVKNAKSIWDLSGVDSCSKAFEFLMMKRIQYIKESGYILGNQRFNQENTRLVQASADIILKKIQEIYTTSDLISISALNFLTLMHFTISTEIQGYKPDAMKMYLLEKYKTHISPYSNNGIVSEISRLRCQKWGFVESIVSRNYSCHLYGEYKTSPASSKSPVPKLDSVINKIDNSYYFAYPDNRYLIGFELLKRWAVKCKPCRPGDPKICAPSWYPVLRLWRNQNKETTIEFNYQLAILNLRTLNYLIHSSTIDTIISRHLKL